MTAYRINDAELNALAGESAEVVQLYLVALRPRMDFKTGVIGRRVRISYQALREWTERWGRPGVRYYAHDKSKLQRLLARLEDIGLLRRMSGDYELVFACPLADADYCVPKKADTKSMRINKPKKSRKNKVLGTLSTAPKTPKADTHPGSGNTLPPPPTSSPSQASAEPAGRALSGMPEPTPADAATEGIASKEFAKREGEPTTESGIIWPSGLTTAQQQSIKRSAAASALPPPLIQRVLDEWLGAQRAGVVRDAWPYYHQLLRNAAAQGEAWVTYYADSVSEQRLRDRQRLAYLAREEADFGERIGGRPGPLPPGALVQLQKQLAAARPRRARA